MNQETIYILLLITPFVIGGIIAAFNADEVNNATEKAEAWLRKNQTNLGGKKGWLSRYIINPVLWMIVKFSDWTDGFEHRGLKNGIRVTATLYLLAAWLYLLFAAFIIIAVIAVGWLILYVVFKILLNSDENVKKGYEASRRVIGPTGRGKRVNPDTGRIEEKGVLGWHDTDQRIDPETGNIQVNGMLGWNNTETRINQGTGNLQKEGFFGYNDTDVRINPDTGIIQRKGVLGWVDTDERINTESGKHQKRGTLGWVDE